MTAKAILFSLLLGYLSQISLTEFASAADAEKAGPFLEVRSESVLKGLIHLPGLLVTKADTAIIIAQSRLQKGDFDPSDVVVTRSLDQGRTWEQPVTLFKSGDSDKVGYSCMLVEDITTTPATILAYYTVGPKGWKADQLEWFGRKSQDEGKTWSEPFSVKHDGDPDSKPSNGGHGFQFAESGRLVIPGRKHLLYSDDGGMSWVTSNHNSMETVETKAVSLVDASGRESGEVYMISRKTTNYKVYGNSGESIVRQGDHGNVFTTKGRNPGLARHSTKLTGSENMLLMSGIIETKENKGKVPLSLTYSTDEGQTWSAPKQLDTKGWYSDIGVTRDGTILVAYTIGFSNDLKVARLNLPWLLQKE